jgi:putative hydrolase of the HAD superfamily
VEACLEALQRHHRLILLTKGDDRVQREKLARSGLGPYFEGVHVVWEKDADVFRDLVAQYDLEPERTWMVGNSPRSDVNPAVEAGIGGVYVPHSNTWELEIEGLVTSDRVTVLERFAELPKLVAQWDEDGTGAA